MKTRHVGGILWLLAWTFSAHAASKAPYGHGLRLLVPKEGITAAENRQFDLPEAGWAAHTQQETLCRATSAGLDWVLAENVPQPSIKRLVLQLQPKLLSETGKPFTTNDLLNSWKQLLSPRAPTVYRRLLNPLQRNGQWTLTAQTTNRLEFELNVPLERFVPGLCHPALGFSGMGPFAGSNWMHNRFHARGRPFLAGLEVTLTQEASPSSQFDVRVGASGEGSSNEGKALYVTYLGFRPDAVEPSLHVALDQSSLRQELTQRFVKKPAFPMTELLPHEWMAQRAVTSAEKKPPRRPPNNSPSLQLVFDETQPSHRAVAERLQVKMHDWGYSVELRAVPTKQLWARWESGDYDFMLHTLLLPSSPGVAWELIKELGKNKEATWPANEVAIQEAFSGRTHLPFIPLYSQALRVTSSTQLQNFSFDAQGLPVFDDVVWLGE